MTTKTVTVNLTVDDPKGGDTDVYADVMLDIDEGRTYGAPEDCVAPSCDAEVVDSYHFDGSGHRYGYVLKDKDADRACELAMEEYGE